jgi:hypothetical protein
MVDGEKDNQRSKKKKEKKKGDKSQASLCLNFIIYFKREVRDQ